MVLVARMFVCGAKTERGAGSLHDDPLSAIRDGDNDRMGRDEKILRRESRACPMSKQRDETNLRGLFKE